MTKLSAILISVLALSACAAPARADDRSLYCKTILDFAARYYDGLEQVAEQRYRDLRFNWLEMIVKYFNEKLTDEERSALAAAQADSRLRRKLYEKLTFETIERVMKAMPEVEWAKRQRVFKPDPGQIGMAFVFETASKKFKLRLCAFGKYGNRCLSVDLLDKVDDLQEIKTQGRALAGFPKDSKSDFLAMQLPKECASKAEVSQSRVEDTSSKNAPLTDCLKLPETIIGKQVAH